MGLTVNCQRFKKVSQPSKMENFNRQLNQAKLTVKDLVYLIFRTIIASNNGVK